jgi:hypothetical protein
MSAYLRNCALAALIFVAMLPNAPAVAADAQTYVVLHASEPPLAAGSGRFYFYREDGLLGMAIQPTIMINGQSAGGRAKPGDYFYVDVPAGSYRISTETEKEEAISTNIAVGESLYIRFDVHMGLFAGHVSPSVIDAQKAATEIKDCDFHTPKSIPSFATPAATPVADAAQPQHRPPAQRPRWRRWLMLSLPQPQLQRPRRHHRRLLNRRQRHFRLHRRRRQIRRPSQTSQVVSGRIAARVMCRRSSFCIGRSKR